MLEYVFFQDAPRKRFQELLKEHGVTWTLEGGETETLVVIDEAGVDDDLAERIELVYDELFALEQASLNARRQGRPDAKDAANGLKVRLRDGRTLYPKLPPELESRLLAAISPEDLRLLADAVANAIENPDPYAC